MLISQFSSLDIWISIIEKYSEITKWVANLELRKLEFFIV